MGLSRLVEGVSLLGIFETQVSEISSNALCKLDQNLEKEICLGQTAVLSR